MAKFNKDTFINVITSKVQSAINKHLLSKEDIESNDLKRLHGFVQYELTEYIEDRKFALDVLSDFNYDEKYTWGELEKSLGAITSVMDLALVNLWKFLEAEGATEYSYYKTPTDDEDDLMLDAAKKDDDKFGEAVDREAEDERSIEDDIDQVYDEDEGEKPKNRFRFDDED